MSTVITGIVKGSPAEKKHISAGSTLLAVNGHAIEDVLDYRFYITDSRVEIELEEKGTKRRVHFCKNEYDDIGLEFETYLMDEKRRCRNNCIFCFIDQLPDGMRDSLYFKDDDARLSFLMGNYITLTNLRERDVARIIEMHISPVNISVHTMNPELRVKMMRNKNAGEALKIIPRLASAGIKLNCQLVLCKGINDGAELEHSLNELGALCPNVESISVVPVGLSKYRDKNGLFVLEPFEQSDAESIVKTLEAFGDEMLKRHGSRIAYAADEFYIKSGRPMPKAEFYGEFKQLENGVGLVASLQSEFESAVKLNDIKKLNKERRVSIATGVAACPFIDKFASLAQNSVAGLSCKVYSIINDFFGSRITVSGLLTGGDLASQLKGRDLGDELLIPKAMLRSGSDVFLDDLTVGGLSSMLGVRVTPVSNDGFELLDTILGIKC